MTLTRDKFVTVARSYIGTPYHAHGRVRGAGVDCSGLLYCTLCDCGLAYRDCTDYRWVPRPGLLLEKMREQFVEIHTRCAGPGDIFICNIEPGKSVQHILILTETGIIHTDVSLGGVFEHAFNLFWADRIAHAFRLKELAASESPVAWPSREGLIAAGYDSSEELRRLQQGGCCSAASEGVD